MELLSVNKSYFELQRLRYRPDTLFLLDLIRSLHIDDVSPATNEDSPLFPYIPNLCRIPEVTLRQGEDVGSKPLRIGVLLSGGQAPGGHNVVIGLFEGLQAFNKNNRLFGFIQGPLGLTRGLYKELDVSMVYDYYNVGGFDMLSSSNEKIKTKEQKSTILANVKKLKLDGLLIIGGNNSNTDTAMLAEYFLEHNCKTTVIGVPKTIDGDLKNEWIETSLGFHTSCRTYTEMIGNLAKDVLSTKKYYHFVRLMGQKASYTTLECGLQTHPNITIIGESIAAQNRTLVEISKEIAQGLVRRYHTGKNYGILLIPEGLIEHATDTKRLIDELNCLLIETQSSPEELTQRLSPEAQQTLLSLPKEMRRQLLIARDSYGNVRVSLIAMEELLASLVHQEIQTLDPTIAFSPVTHFFGYESRAGFPSNFDSNYGLALGILSALFLVREKTGYMVTVNNLASSYHQWSGGGTPLYKMMHIEQRLGESVPVIKTETVSPDAPAVHYLQSKQEQNLLYDQYTCPGALQFREESEWVDKRPLTLLWDAGLFPTELF